MSAKVRDLLERIVATFLVAFIGTLVAQHTTGQVRWSDALGVALGAAVLSVGTTVVVVWLGLLHVADPLADLGVRSALTFVQTLLAAMAADSVLNLFTFHWAGALLASLLAAAGSALKGLTGIANAGTQGASVAVPANMHTDGNGTG